MPHGLENLAPMPASDATCHIGMRLRSRREALELSIADVSATTHLRPDYLTAIETLNTAALPALGYALGFVRTYARALGLDPAAAVADYKSDVAAPENLRLRDTPHFVLQRRIRLPRGFAAAVGVVAIASMLGVWYGVQTETQAAPLAAPVIAQLAGDTAPAQPVMVDGLITLRTTAPSWVQIRDAGGNVIVSRIFVTGETWQGPAAGGYTVSVRDAGAVERFIGPDAQGPIGKPGEPLKDVALN